MHHFQVFSNALNKALWDIIFKLILLNSLKKIPLSCEEYLTRCTNSQTVAFPLKMRYRHYFDSHKLNYFIIKLSKIYQQIHSRQPCTHFEELDHKFQYFSPFNFKLEECLI